jgi:phosphate transport system substrate-binding protein
MNFVRRMNSADLLRKPFTMLAILGLAALLVLAITACGDDDEGNGGGETTSTPEEDGGAIDYSTLSGEIRIDGSSTVFPISEAVAEEFSAVSDVNVNVAFSGTGGGFEAFCRGEIEIADASRPIEEDETQACTTAGIDDIVELQVGTDALTVVVNPANDFVTCLTVEQLHEIFKEGGATTWDQVDPSFPAESIVLYYPGTDSGTYDYFVDEIITGVDEAAAHTSEPTSSEDDNVLAQGVGGDDFSIGYFGIAYYLGAGQDLKAVEVDSGDGCVAPSEETALDGTYTPLSRPLFIYTTESFLEDRPEVLGFVNFYLENSQQLVTEVNYVALPEDVHDEQVAKIEPYLEGGSGGGSTSTP